MPPTSDPIPRGVMYRLLNTMCEHERSWADVQRYFSRNCDVCTDGGYFESLMMLWKHYGQPARMRFFRKALSARYWNPLLIMGTAEYSQYERLPPLIWSLPTRRNMNGWVEFVTLDELSCMTAPDARVDLAVGIAKSDVFAVQIHHGKNTLIVLNPPAAPVGRVAMSGQRRPFATEIASRG